MNKLTSVKSDFFTFENCENIKCENSQFAYHTIDRVISSLKYYSKTRKNEKYITMYEYQCEKMDKKF